jgi:hypothetical protein
VVAKNDARQKYEKQLRIFVQQYLANNPKVPNSAREKMGLTIRSTERTEVGIPGTYPTPKIDFSVRLQHTISVSDSETPNSKAKPAGAHGFEVWAKVGVAPKNEKELIFLKTSTKPSAIVTFGGDDAGKTVFYWLRWVNTKGESGPWGPQVQAMIAG